MNIPVTTSAYGPAAHTALAKAIGQAKASDRLASVSVIVSSNRVGFAARRSLGRRGGIAAVTFLTPYQLADLLGSSGIAATGRRPVSSLALTATIRAVLHDQPGYFEGVHTHPATECSLAKAYRDLSEVNPDGLRQLERTSSRTADIVRVHREVTRRVNQQFADEHQLVSAAIAALEKGSPVLRDLGSAILFLPQRLSPTHRRLLHAFGRTRPLRVIMGVTGDTDADAPVQAGIEAIGGLVELAAVPAQIADHALSVSDADDEVRHAIRGVVEASLRGESLSRCAILYGSRQPYFRLISDALNAADIAWFGASGPNATASLLGRSLLAMLALPDRNFSRHDVSAWLESAPVRGSDNRLAPVAAWGRAARAAGVVAGIDQWKERVTLYREDQVAHATELDRDAEQKTRATRKHRDADHAGQLVEFITTLADSLTPGPEVTTWVGLAAWCRQLVQTYFGGENQRQRWPDDEQTVAQSIDAIIDRLGELDGIDIPPGMAVFRETLKSQLDETWYRHGRFGTGVLVGPVSFALGVELDTVIVVGMAEGALPTYSPDDPLLPDRVRATIGPELPRRADAVHDQHRELLAAMAAASRVLFTFPRGDLRQNAAHAPSRWLLDTTEARDNIRPAAADLNRLTGDWLTEVPSFISGLRACAFPATEQEYDVRALLDHTEAGGYVHNLALVNERVAIRRGFDLLKDRLSRHFTRFDGNLQAGNLRNVRLAKPGDPDQVNSATRLERWTKCPHAYFVQHVLGVKATEDPEDQYRISPLDRGSMVHQVLADWLQSALETEPLPSPGAAWSTNTLDALTVHAEREIDHLERRGMVGRPVYWGRDRQVIMDDFDWFVDFDQQQRADYQSHPIATELAFGMPGSAAEPVELSLPDGRTLRLRGAIDRVDETASGELIVIDYKTGSSRGYAKLSSNDPTLGGTHLQLVLYALAAQVILGRPDAPTRGQYWFVSDKGGFDTAGYAITDDVYSEGLAIIAQIVNGIESGFFPPRPAAGGFASWIDCHFCDPDSLGLSYQVDDWNRTSNDDQLKPYLALIGDPRA